MQQKVVECVTTVAVGTVRTVRLADAKNINVGKCLVGAEMVKQYIPCTAETSSECQRGLTARSNIWTWMLKVNPAGNDKSMLSISRAE